MISLRSPLTLISPLPAPTLGHSRTRSRGSGRSHVSAAGLPPRPSPPIVNLPCIPTESDRTVEPREQETTSGDDGRTPLPPCLRRRSLPGHVAVIMDGNSRWAAARGLPASAGHEAGYRSLRHVVSLSVSWGIPVLTVFAFSSENWFRPKTEVYLLMQLFERVLKENNAEFMREGIQVSIVGDSSKLPKCLQKLSKEAEELTRDNSRLQLIVAIGYSGRRDIVQACQKIAQKVKDNLLEPGDITESLFAQELETNCTVKFPYPDLLIRTSGELRLSNFLLWQSAYAELFFAKSHWPDFGEADYVEALYSYQTRQRRFGQRHV